jgi:hypothetical protein
VRPVILLCSIMIMVPLTLWVLGWKRICAATFVLLAAFTYVNWPISVKAPKNGVFIVSHDHASGTVGVLKYDGDTGQFDVFDMTAKDGYRHSSKKLSNSLRVQIDGLIAQCLKGAVHPRKDWEGPDLYRANILASGRSTQMHCGQPATDIVTLLGLNAPRP